jgi:hypothetical protein
MRLAIATAALGVTTLASSSALAQLRIEGRIHGNVGGPTVVTAPPPPTYVPPRAVNVDAPGPVNVQPPVYAQPVPPGYAQPGWGRAWRNPAVFSARVRGRMNEIENETRADVARGVVAPQALNVLAQQRAQVEQSLAQIAADGVVQPRERRYMNGILEDMDDVDLRFRVRPYYGGGPGGAWHWHQNY